MQVGESIGVEYQAQLLRRVCAGSVAALGDTPLTEKFAITTGKLSKILGSALSAWQRYPNESGVVPQPLAPRDVIFAGGSSNALAVFIAMLRASRVARSHEAGSRGLLTGFTLRRLAAPRDAEAALPENTAMAAYNTVIHGLSFQSESAVLYLKFLRDVTAAVEDLLPEHPLVPESMEQEFVLSVAYQLVNVICGEWGRRLCAWCSRVVYHSGVSALDGDMNGKRGGDLAAEICGAAKRLLRVMFKARGYLLKGSFIVIYYVDAAGNVHVSDHREGDRAGTAESGTAPLLPPDSVRTVFDAYQNAFSKLSLGSDGLVQRDVGWCADFDRALAALPADGLGYALACDDAFLCIVVTVGCRALRLSLRRAWEGHQAPMLQRAESEWSDRRKKWRGHVEKRKKADAATALKVKKFTEQRELALLDAQRSELQRQLRV